MFRFPVCDPGCSFCLASPGAGNDFFEILARARNTGILFVWLAFAFAGFWFVAHAALEFLE